MRITRGALIVFGLQCGLSIVWLLSNADARLSIMKWVVASPSQVFDEYKVWTLVTSTFFESKFLSLIFVGLMMWMLVPTLERFWGTGRFYRFVAVTSVVGTTAGVLMGKAIGSDVAVYGLAPFMYASIVAFGVVYARQPVQFFGVLPLSGRQFMWGMIAFVALFVLLQQLWVEAVAYASAMLAAAIMTSKRWSPGLAWKRWRIARARARLSVIEGGAPKPPAKPKRDEQRFLN